MKATDVFKLLHQGVFGVGHILGEGARRRLKAEAASLSLEDHPEEPLMEAVSWDGSMVRVNLRPYLRRNLPLEGLFDAMEKTAGSLEHPEEFLEAWTVFKELVVSGVFEVDREEFQILEDEVRNDETRPHHHSEAYRNAYHPAYRVVRREALEKALDHESIS